MARKPRHRKREQPVEGQMAFDFFSLAPLDEAATAAGDSGSAKTQDANDKDVARPSEMAEDSGALGADPDASPRADAQESALESAGRAQAASGVIPSFAGQDGELAESTSLTPKPELGASREEGDDALDSDERPAWPVPALSAEEISAAAQTGGQANLSARGRAAANVRALQALAQLRAGAPLDEAAARALASFSGWGAAADAFSGKIEWTGCAEELSTLMTDDELRSAAASTLTSFYTPKGLTEALWAALGELGFSGGRVLEPGCGAGNILRDAPEGILDACDVRAVEIDPTAAEVAAALVPSADVLCADFSKVRFDEGSFDAVIGNVPFSPVSVTAPGHRPMPLHDFYFARALDAVKPGGAVAFVTSRGTMDKASTRTRAELAQRAELVAACRLPDGAFSGQAGTDVGTDVIVLRKLEEGEREPDAGWVDTVELAEGVRENAWFAEHPEHVLGEAKIKVGKFGPELSVDSHVGDVFEQLKASLAGQIARSAARMSDTPAKGSCALSVAGRSGEQDAYSTDADGKVFFGERDVTPKKAADAQRLSAMVNLAGLLRRQLALERDGAPDAEAEEARTELAAAYGSFTERYGLLHDKKNDKLYANADPMRPALMSLEQEAGEGKFEPAAILSRRVVGARPQADVRTPEDALAWSLSEFGEVDMGEMARRLDMPYDELWQALSGKVFLDADAGAWVTSDEFLSGNVRRKLAAAQEAKEQMEGALASAAQDAWRDVRGLPNIKTAAGSARAGLSALLAAGRSLPKNRYDTDADWAELPETSELPIEDEAAWAEVARGIEVGWHKAGALDRAIDGKIMQLKIDAAAGEATSAWDAARWCEEHGVNVLPEGFQARIVASGGAAIAGKEIDSRMTLECAVQRAVGDASAQLRVEAGGKSARYGYDSAGEFADDPALGELSWLIWSNAPGYEVAEIAQWLEAAQARAASKHEADLRYASRTGYVKPFSVRVSEELGNEAWERALEKVAALIPGYRAERARFIETFRDMDAPAAAAYRSRAAHLDANIEALSAAVPADLAPADIAATLGSTWIPADDVRDFIAEEIGLRWSFDKDNIQVSYSPVTAKWSVRAAGVEWSAEGAEKWGTSRVRPIEMVKASLNCSRVTVRDPRTELDPKTGKEKTVKVVNAAETMAAQEKQSALEERFAAWCWEGSERAERLAKIYNERFNSVVPRRFSGEGLAFPEMSREIELRPWQRDAVARILYSKTGTLLAHTVGAGKTMEFCAGAMESRRLGLAAKPMIVVPNHLVEQTAQEFLSLYPAARLLVARKEDFKKERRRELMARAATGDWDSIIVGQTQFEMLPLSPGEQRRYVQSRIDEFEEAEMAAREESGSRDPTVKELQRQLAGFQARMDKLLKDERKDDAAGVTFDAMGVDMLVVDEAHAYKNLTVQTKMSRVAGVSSSGSQRSEDMLMKCRWLRERYGARNVVFATGTPVSNSMVELYNMQAYLDPATMESMGISCFDEWATTFGRREVAFEITPEGDGYQQKERFSRFVNVPELMSLARTFADIKTAEDIELKLPECEVHAVVVEPTEEQEAAVEELIERAEAIRERRVSDSADNMLKVTGDGRKVALDVRLLDPDNADPDARPGGKVEACAENVARIWRETAADSSAQLVFCDTSTPSSGRWNIYADLKARLVELGVPAEEIAFVHDAGDKPEAKEALFARVRRGEVRVLVGSTEKMGTGTNVQERLVATHDLDCPWRPADLEQRQGRIVRQGNRNEHVDVYRYVCKGTFDSYLYQLVEGKQRFVSQVFSADAEAREVGDMDDAVALSYAQMKAAATGNPLIREKMELENQVSRLSMLKGAHDKSKQRAQARAQGLPHKVEELQEKLDAARKAASMVEGAAFDDADEQSWCCMDVEGRRFSTARDAGFALVAAADRVPSGQTQQIGRYRGLAVVARMEVATGRPVLGLTAGEERMMVPRSVYVQLVPNVKSLDKVAARFLELPGEIETEMQRLEEEAAAAARAAEASFEHEEALAVAQARLAEIDDELGITGTEESEEEGEVKEAQREDAGTATTKAPAEDAGLGEIKSRVETAVPTEVAQPGGEDAVSRVPSSAKDEGGTRVEEGVCEPSRNASATPAQLAAERVAKKRAARAAEKAASGNAEKNSSDPLSASQVDAMRAVYGGAARRGDLAKPAGSHGLGPMPEFALAGTFDPTDPPASQAASLLSDLALYANRAVRGLDLPEVAFGSPAACREALEKVLPRAPKYRDACEKKLAGLDHMLQARGLDWGGAKVEGTKEKAQAEAAASPREEASGFGPAALRAVSLKKEVDGDAVGNEKERPVGPGDVVGTPEAAEVAGEAAEEPSSTGGDELDELVAEIERFTDFKVLGKPFSGFRLGSAKACSQRITELAKGSGERGRQALAAVEAQRERIRQAKRDGAGQAGAQGGAVQPCPAGEAVHSRKPNVRK